MEEKKSKFAGLKKIFFTDEYIEETFRTSSDNLKEETIKTPEKVNASHFTVTDSNSLSKETNSIVDKIYKYLDSINTTEIDFIEVWDAMEEMGGINESNLKATVAAMKVVSKGALTKELIINSGIGYLGKITDQLNSDLNSKNSEIQAIEAKKKDESSFLITKKKEIEDNIKKLQAELVQTDSFIKDLDFKYEPKIKEVQTKMNAGQSALSKISAEINNIISLVKKTL